MQSRIFVDPTFIRKNTLLNFLHSHFPSEELQSKVITNTTDPLRAYYHNLSLENIKTDRIEALSFVYSCLQFKFAELSDLDWFYCERISIHFANFSRTVGDRILSVFNRH